MIEIILLSIIQGITEFLPISSSSHLILISNYINFDNRGLSIDVSLHIGSFLAVVLYFKHSLTLEVSEQQTKHNNNHTNEQTNRQTNRQTATQFHLEPHAPHPPLPPTAN